MEKEKIDDQTNRIRIQLIRVTWRYDRSQLGIGVTGSTFRVTRSATSHAGIVARNAGDTHDSSQFTSVGCVSRIGARGHALALPQEDATLAHYCRIRLEIKRKENQMKNQVMDNQRVNKEYQHGKIKWKQRKNTKSRISVIFNDNKREE